MNLVRFFKNEVNIYREYIGNNIETQINLWINQITFG